MLVASLMFFYNFVAFFVVMLIIRISSIFSENNNCVRQLFRIGLPLFMIAYALKT